MSQGWSNFQVFYLGKIIRNYYTPVTCYHEFLFNIRNYSPEAINIQRREAELNIIFLRVNNFDIKQKRHEIIVFYMLNTKQDLAR